MKKLQICFILNIIKMVFFIEIVLFVLSMLCYVIWANTKPKNFPPGPTGLPIVGSIPFVKEPSYKYYAKISQTYGGLCSIKLGNRDILILNDWKCMKEALVVQGNIFSGRPSMAVWDAAMKKEDIITGRMWKDQKRFALQHLRDFGVGKVRMEIIIMEEVNKTLEYLEENNNGNVLISGLFFAPIFSIINRISTGKTYNIMDKSIEELSKTVGETFKFFKIDNKVNFLPFLLKIPGATNFNKSFESHLKIAKVIEDEIKHHEDTYTEGSPRDFIDVYLKELYDRKGTDTSNTPYQNKYLKGTLYNLFNAGVETTEHTLSFGLLYLALWPEIQQKVQKELDYVIGTGRIPYYTDRNILPYTQATILEIHRFTSVAPLSFPHAPLVTTTLMGYTIPKGTFVLQNIWAVNNDTELWGDPEVFRPERFLDEHGKVQKPEYLIPFSTGPRFCIGEQLANMELFLFFTCLLQRFSFHCVTGQIPPSTEPLTNVTLRPQPFSLTVKQR